MGKGVLVVLLFEVVFLAFNPKHVCGDNFLKDQDDSNILDQFENMHGGIDQPKDEDLYDDENWDEKFDDDGLDADEIKAINANIEYEDAARDTMLKFSAELRKRKGATHDVTNAFLKVVGGFEKEIAEFHATQRRRRVRPSTIKKLDSLIEEAAKNKKASVKILRSLTSQGLFLTQLERSGRKRGVDSLKLGARKFLKRLETKIGDEEFKDLLAVDGEVTLIFAIDDTGSMYDEIAAAQAISESIVKSRNKDAANVDYILSPFNDPGKFSKVILLFILQLVGHLTSISIAFLSLYFVVELSLASLSILRSVEFLRSRMC